MVIRHLKNQIIRVQFKRPLVGDHYSKNIVQSWFIILHKNELKSIETREAALSLDC